LAGRRPTSFLAQEYSAKALKVKAAADFSQSRRIHDYLTLILEAQNLTEEHNTLFIDSVREDTLFRIDIGRPYTLGATIKF
jgi:hypothetical protein